MGSLHHRDIKNSESSIITYRAQQRDDEQQSVKYLPDDIWRENLTQLPLKPLCISRCVCKAWRDYTRRRQYVLENRPGCVPLCGLFLISHNPQGEEETSDECVSYFCLRARLNFVLSHENSPIFPSRVRGGLMRDICFDFSMLHDFCETQAPLRFFGMHGGLLHLTYTDGTEQVHNPVTKQIYNVLKSPIVDKYGFDKHTVEEMRGLIIQVRPPHRSRRCGFVVVRFCVGESTIEFYRTRTCYWEAYPFKLDDEFLRSSHRLLYRNHAFFVDNGVVSLYVLTSSNFGIAIKFKGMMNPETRHFNFPLPEAALEGVNGRRIWASDGLYLTYYNETGLWIWKAAYTTDVDKWAWVPILEINPTKQVAKPGALKHLPKRVLNGGISVKPVAFVPTVPMLERSLLISVACMMSIMHETVEGRLLMITSDVKPEPNDAAAYARWLVSHTSWGVLNTLAADRGGAPFGNVASFSDGIPGEGTGIPYFYLTKLDPTVEYALKDQRCSFTISEHPIGTCGVTDPENPTCAKITLSGKLRLMDQRSKEAEFARAALFAKHREMKDWPESHNFEIYKLQMEDIFLINWFGGRKPLTVNQYLQWKM